LSGSDLGEMFGIELATSDEPAQKPKRKRRIDKPPAKARARKPTAAKKAKAKPTKPRHATAK
jgi:hypothetical protein